MTKILCPECHHVLGNTDRSFDGQINCRWCRKAVAVKLKVANTNDYFKMKGDNK